MNKRRITASAPVFYCNKSLKAKRPSVYKGPVHTNPDTFETAYFFFFCETAFRPHETSEPHILKALSGVHLFGSDGFGYFVWTTDNGYFDVNYVVNASSVSNENSRIQNGGHYIDSTMFCLQLCLLLSPFLSHAFRYFDDNN